MKHYTVQVFFTCLDSQPLVNPPFESGKRDAIWIQYTDQAYSQKVDTGEGPFQEKLKAFYASLVSSKMQACYGISIDPASVTWNQPILLD